MNKRKWMKLLFPTVPLDSFKKVLCVPHGKCAFQIWSIFQFQNINGSLFVIASITFIIHSSNQNKWFLFISLDASVYISFSDYHFFSQKFLLNSQVFFLNTHFLLVWTFIHMKRINHKWSIKNKNEVKNAEPSKWKAKEAELKSSIREVQLTLKKMAVLRMAKYIWKLKYLRQRRKTVVSLI